MALKLHAMSLLHSIHCSIWYVFIHLTVLSLCRLDDLKKRDEEKDLLEKAKNEIEAFVFDAQDKLDQKNYRLCSTEDERIAIKEKLASVSDWLIEQEDSTPRKVCVLKLLHCGLFSVI